MSCRCCHGHSAHHPQFTFFFLLTRQPPRSPLFPYTTLFRSSTSTCRAGVIDLTTKTKLRGFGSYLPSGALRSEEHTSELQSHSDLVCRLLLEKKKKRCPCEAAAAIRRTLRRGGRQTERRLYS